MIFTKKCIQKTLFLLSVLTAVVTLTPIHVFAFDLTLDPAFENSTDQDRFDGEVESTYIDSNGKILVGGNFTSYGGTTVGRLVRLNADGTLDTTFNTNIGTGFNDVIRVIMVDSNGKILVGGDFTTFNDSVDVGRFVRLNANGTLDTDFATTIGTGFDAPVHSILVDADERIVVGGEFVSFNDNGMPHIVRLDSSGATDTDFVSNIGDGFDDTVRTLQLVGTRIIAGGDFDQFNGNLAPRIALLFDDGTFSTDFATNIGDGFNAGVFAIQVNSGGKIVVAGEFTEFNSFLANHFAVLNDDGTYDGTIGENIGAGFDSSTFSIKIDSNDKILVGGSFTAFDGASVRRIARINTNGTIDATFASNTGDGFSFEVNTIQIDSNGRIVVGGDFQEFNGVPVNRIARLEADGTIDDEDALVALVQSFDSNVLSLVVDGDDKIIAGGDFTVFDSVSTNRIARLSSDGTLDTTFATNVDGGFGGSVQTVALDSNNKILAGGSFTTFNGNTVRRIARLNTSGTIDASFVTNIGNGFTNGSVSAIVTDSSGKIVAGGDFTAFNGTTVNRIARLNADGTLDTTFATNIGNGFTNNSVLAVDIDSENRIVAGGSFTAFDGTSVSRIARLESNGTLDTDFVTSIGSGFNGTVRAVQVDSNGKILVGGDFTSFNSVAVGRIARLNADGTLDTTFKTNTGNGFTNNEVYSIQLDSNNKILVGGSFTDFNGTSVNRFARLNSDGTLDATFATSLGTGFIGKIRTIDVDSEDRVVVGGESTQFDEVLSKYISRLIVTEDVVEEDDGPVVEERSASHGSYVRYGCKDENALNYTQFARHLQSLCRYENSQIVAVGPTVPVSSQPTLPVRDITVGMTGGDVLLLQKLLNANGFVLAETGPGSVGNETTMFGSLTRAALARFQATHDIVPAVGYFGPITRAKMKSLNLSGLWW